MNPTEILAQLEQRRNNEVSDIPVRKMSEEQIRNRKRTTINNIAERQMFGITSNNYKNKLKSK